MKDKILFGLFVLLAFSAGFTIGGVGKSATDAPTMSDVLEPFLADYRQRYEILDAERTTLQAELEAVKQDLSDAGASGDTVSVLKAQVLQQQTEIGRLTVALQTATTDSDSWKQRFQQSQYDIGMLQISISATEDTYAVLHSKLLAVDNRESDTVNSFPAEDRVAFYEIWDKWWDLVIDGTD